jgi:thiamine-phosphate pyrophosphorylase
MCCKYRQEIEKYLKLYLVLETDLLNLSLERFIKDVIDGGVTAIQLRDKSKSINERYETGRIVHNILKNEDILFIVNDRIDLALCVNACGTHLGENDLPIEAAKKHFQLIYGYSCNNEKDILLANKVSADYIGIGPAFHTKTKRDLRKVIGVDGISELLKKTNIPAVAIGGITLDNVYLFKNTGLSGVAVSSAICSSVNPKETTKKFIEILYG